MIFRPVSPQSPCGPPSRKQPVGLMWQAMCVVVELRHRVPGGTITQVALDQVGPFRLQRRQDQLVDDDLAGVVGEIILAVLRRPRRSRRAGSTGRRCGCGAACRRRCIRRSPGSWRRAGANFSSPLWRSSAWFSTRRWARSIGSGIRVLVSSQAKPNIMPWSPAPPMSTPMAMSPDCGCRWQSTWQVSAAKPMVGIDVADLADGLADQVVDGVAGQVGLGGDLAGDDGQVGGDQRFAGDPAGRVGLQAVIEDGVADLVGHLVGMAHRHGFAGKQVSVGVHESSPRAEVSGGSPCKSRR